MLLQNIEFALKTATLKTLKTVRIEKSIGSGDSMSIVITYFGFLATKLSTKNDSVELSKGDKIRDLFHHLIEKYKDVFKTYIYDPEGEKVNGDVLISINDIPILQMQGLDTILNDGDRIDVLPIFAGGG
jgi:molybdopterin converting factor small subunit